MKDVEIIGMLKSYISKTLVGMGALKGAPCQVDSITNVDGSHTVTLKWIDNEGTSHTNSFTVLDGEQGEQGPQGIQGPTGEDGADGFSPTITVKESTSSTYILTITTADDSFDTPNLKGGGSGGASSLSDLSDVVLTSIKNGDALVYNSTAGKWENKALGSAAYKDSTNAVTKNSTDLVESGAVETAIDNARGDITETQYSDIATILS